MSRPVVFFWTESATLLFSVIRNSLTLYEMYCGKYMYITYSTENFFRDHFERKFEAFAD